MVVEFIKKNLKGDKGIWLAVALLGLLGLPVVYSATGLLAIKGTSVTRDSPSTARNQV